LSQLPPLSDDVEGRHNEYLAPVLDLPKIVPFGKMKEFALLDHGDYSETDTQCCCVICMEWRRHLLALQRLQAATLSHERSCHCADCRSKMKTRSSYLASLNRRDLYSESSWHAAHMEDSIGEKFMGWLRGVLLDRGLRSDGWWEIRAPNLPLAQWQLMFRRAEAAGVSGLV